MQSPITGCMTPFFGRDRDRTCSVRSQRGGSRGGFRRAVAISAVRTGSDFEEVGESTGGPPPRAIPPSAEIERVESEPSKSWQESEISGNVKPQFELLRRIAASPCCGDLPKRL